MKIVSELAANLVNCDSLFAAEQLILKTTMKLAQEVMANFLESLDDQLATQAPESYQVVNRKERTINFAFSPVTLKRRYYQLSV